jgi:hypothetical protein
VVVDDVPNKEVVFRSIYVRMNFIYGARILVHDLHYSTMRIGITQDSVISKTRERKSVIDTRYCTLLKQRILRERFR